MGLPSRMAAPLAVGSVGLLACAYVYAVDPGEPGHYPACPLKALVTISSSVAGMRSAWITSSAAQPST